jgi:hypothetical protein
MRTYELVFRCSAIVILVVTASAKLFSASGSAPLLDYPDPLFGLANRHLMILVGLIELGVAVGLLSALDIRRKHLLLAWLSTSFLVYRLAFYVLNPDKSCPCLGTLGEKLRLGQTTTNALLWSTVLYLLIGSVCCLAARVRSPEPWID